MVLNFSLQPDQPSQVEFLLSKDLPHLFIDRYGPIPSKVYIRRCYKQLYGITADKMASGHMEMGVTLFTGVSGIGKSLFLIYFLYRFLHDDRFPDKSFALEFNRGVYLMFEPTLEADDVFTCSRVDSHSIDFADSLVLCDINQPVEPSGRSKWLLIFSSPDRARYKQIIKNGPTYSYTLPTWSEQELTSCDNRVQLWYDNFVRFGGVPRYVLPRSNAAEHATHLDVLLESAVFRSGGLIARDVFKFGFNTLDVIEHELLIHMNPPRSSSGSDFQYNGVPEFSFASDHVFQLLAAKHGAMVLSQAANVFNVGGAASTSGSASAGPLFDKDKNSLSLEGHTFIAAALGRADGETKRFAVPSSRELLPDDWKEAPLLGPDMHYLSHNSNLESGDSFYLTEISAGEYLLVVFQFTTASEHKVKAKGLKNIVQAFKASLACNITQKALVFVMPKHGQLAAEQAMVTRKGEVMAEASLPRSVRGFQQYVYRREI